MTEATRPPGQFWKDLCENLKDPEFRREFIALSHGIAAAQQQAEPSAGGPSDVPPHQQAGYDAVYAVIRAEPGDVWRNATIWRAVEAYRAASEPAHDRQVRERVAREIEETIDADVPGDYEAGLQRAAQIAQGGS